LVFGIPPQYQLSGGIATTLRIILLPPIWGKILDPALIGFELALFFRPREARLFSQSFLPPAFTSIGPLRKLGLFCAKASVNCRCLGFRVYCLGFPGKARRIGFVFSN